MGWATDYIERLKRREIVQFRPTGKSMEPIIHSGDLCTVEPYEQRFIHKGDIVLCTVKGKQYLHIIKNIKDDLYQIGNNRGHTNGWIKFENIHGKLTKVSAL